MKQLTLTVFAAFILLASCTNKVSTQNIEVEAPFEMPAITIPDFSGTPEYVITDFGAENQNIDKNTKAIKKAIEKAHKNGGGIVVIPEGEWLTKKIHLKSHVNLHLEKGATLLFSDNPDHYLPAVHTTWEGIECYNYSPLIYAYECENVAITGSGKLKAQMGTWQKWFGRPAPHMNSLKWLYHQAAQYKPVENRMMANDSSNLRPHFIQFNRCQNILIDGISISRSPFWTIHPYLSKNIVIRNINVMAHGHNNDGVDPEMSQNILIENCIFDQGDDAIAIKSGRNQDSWRLNTPTKNLVMRNCTVKNGHQLVAIGSELSGGVENVFVDNCEVLDGAKMFHLVFIKTNERRGGYVKNIHVSNIKAGSVSKGILGIETDVLYQWRDIVPTYEVKLTPISDIYIENVKSKNVDFISNIDAQAKMPIKNIQMQNVVADTIRAFNHKHKNVEGFTFDGKTIENL
jgi:polygalacturonase